MKSRTSRRRSRLDRERLEERDLLVVAREIAQHLGDEFVGRVRFDIYKGGGTVSVTIGLGQLPLGPLTRVHDMLMVERRQRKSASDNRLRRRAP